MVDRFSLVLGFQGQKWLSVNPFLRIVVVPDWELHFEKWRFFCRLNLNHSDLFFGPAVL